MSTFRKLVDAIRYAPGGRVNGTWQEGAPTAFQIRASVQPVTGKELENTPLLRRQKGAVYRLYSNDVLETVQSTVQADRVLIEGTEHEVIQKQIWKNNVIPHYKYYVSEVLDK